MRSYYIFDIKKDIHSLYHDKEEQLFYILKRIKLVKKPNLEYGLSIYTQLCDVFDFTTLQRYLFERYEVLPNNKYNFLNYKNKEFSYLELRYPCLFLQTNCLLPKVFDILYLYNRDIFVCDFTNNDYFWLDKLHKYKKDRKYKLSLR